MFKTLENIRRDAEKFRDELGEHLSQASEIKKFLVARGLTHFSQLDGAGREELRRYLEEVLQRTIWEAGVAAGVAGMLSGNSKPSK